MSEPNDPTSLTDAIDQIQGELAAIDPSMFLPINVDLVAAATTVLGVVQEELPAHRAALERIFGPEWLVPIDRLELLAQATLQAHARYRATETPANLQPLISELTKLRDVLAAEVRSLIVRDVLDAEAIGVLTGLTGPKNLCVDALHLVALFRTNWSELAGKTGVSIDYIDRADAVSARLAKAIGKRDQAGQSAAADLRVRAFTLMSRTYDDLRRLMTFLRWKEGDHDRITPSFWAGRKTAPRPRVERDHAADHVAQAEQTREHGVPP